jgi:hypothetical protein
MSFKPMMDVQVREKHIQDQINIQEELSALKTTLIFLSVVFALFIVLIIHNL